MANLIYASINGIKQGLISAGCSTLDSIGNRCQKGHEDQAYILAFDHNISRMQNVSHQPVRITKPIDKSSPLLGMAWQYQTMKNYKLSCICIVSTRLEL